jgi:transcriptional regulator with XRE-family HTH domain
LLIDVHDLDVNGSLSEHGSLAQFLKYQMVMEGITSTKKLGLRIGVSQGTAWRLISKRVVPKEGTLEKVAGAFDVPITGIRALAERPVGEPEPFELPPEADQLTEAERDVVCAVVQAILLAHEKARVTR